MTALPVATPTIARQMHSTRTLACRIMSLLDLTEDDSLLIPAAGRGALLRPILEGRYAMPRTTIAVEQKPSNHSQLVSRLDQFPDAPILAVQGDFLEMGSTYKPSKIAMIPPMTWYRDVQYIMHAWEMLEPGGRLVAVCSTASMTHSSVIAASFRHALSSAGAEILNVQAGSFVDSDKNVDASLVVMTRRSADA